MDEYPRKPFGAGHIGKRCATRKDLSLEIATRSADGQSPRWRLRSCGTLNGSQEFGNRGNAFSDRGLTFHGNYRFSV
jgi:hypothetical protein